MGQTSSTSKLRSSTTSRWALVRRHPKPGEPANSAARHAELLRTLGIVALAALMGLTSWVVASISTWLVPVYVTAMVLIFVTPQVQQLPEPESTGDLSEGRASGASEAASPTSSSPAAQGVTTLRVDGSPGAPPAQGGKPDSVTGKRRRPRGQARKAVKGEPEPDVAVAPAAWVRIGPGKFIRADSVELAQVSSSEESAATVTPETDVTITAVVLQADMVAEEFEPAATPGMPAVDGDSPTDGTISGAATEKYGIAPSAFGPSLSQATSKDENRAAMDRLTGFNRGKSESPH